MGQPDEIAQLDADRARTFVNQEWETSAVPTLAEYIRIPNKSQMFDPKWQAHGHMDRAVELVEGWCRDHALPDMVVETIRLPKRTPLLYIDVPGTGRRTGDTVMLYGHLDKQPEMTGWDTGLGPWTPVLRDDKLYGRGGADDGYALFAAMSALRLLRNQSIPHHRCVIVIESGEESGSPDLPAYIDHLAGRIGTPSLIVCLDSGCGNYDQLWCTTSLRGIITADLAVEVIREGVHSGDASGIVPSSFRILRQLLSRLEDERTGAIAVPKLATEIPAQRRAQAAKVATVLGESVYDKFPFHQDARPISDNLTELVLNRTWRPALSITGVDGIPHIDDAGNVMRPLTAVKLSLRLPPNANAEEVVPALRQLLTADPPYRARVSVGRIECGSGWDARPLSPWLEESLNRASNTYFGNDAVYMGEGGSIPFISVLGKRYSDAQFLITGVLGPHSNAHGPNEFLHLPTARKVSCCVAQVLRDHALRSR